MYPAIGQLADLARRAQGGDHDAAMQLWGMDNGLAQHFSAEQQAMVKRGTEAIGNAALEISLLPEGQRAAAWDQRVHYLSQEFPELKRFEGQYTPENLEGVLDQTGMRPKLIELQQPRYQVAPVGSGLRQTNPYAGVVDTGTYTGGQGPEQPPQSAQPATPRSRAEYDALPPGTPYLGPNGEPMIKGGASPQGSQTFSGN